MSPIRASTTQLIEFTDLDDEWCRLVRDALRCRYELTGVELAAETSL
jgi:hypothetical protein